MNPSGGGFNNPPPPGTEDDYCKSESAVLLEYEGESSASSKIKSESGEDTKSKIDPFLKNPDYVEYEKRRHSPRHRRRSRSRSRRSKKSKGSHRSRSRSRDRHRRTRSRDRRHRRHRSSSSTRSRRGKSKRREKRSRSRRRSRSLSRSRRRRHAVQNHHKSDSEREDPANTSGEIEDDEPTTKENAFKNDGSFLEMFKKMQEEQQKVQAGPSEPAAPMIPPIAKRRGGRILKTGLVEKAKVMDEFMQGDGLDVWSVYMKEVKRYKEACCDDDSKTRPLVK